MEKGKLVIESAGAGDGLCPERTIYLMLELDSHAVVKDKVHWWEQTPSAVEFGHFSLQEARGRPADLCICI